MHVAYAIFGLTLVLHFIPDLFSYIRIAGACSLVYLGLSTAFSGSGTETASQKVGAYKPWRHYATAFLTNSLNPKTSIFVISLYTQVIGVETSLIGQLGWGAFISLSHFVWFALVAGFMSAQRVRGWILAKRRLFNGVTGALLTLFGLLAFMADDAVRPPGK
ncbi:MAG: LysE family transporter [Hyphomicrobiales bacterium]